MDVVQNKWLKRQTIILLITLFVAGYIGIKQNSINRQLLNLEQLLERPYINISAQKAYDFNNLLDIKDDFISLGFTFNIENIGKLPAKLEKFTNVLIIVKDKDEKILYSSSDSIGAEFVVFPEETAPIIHNIEIPYTNEKKKQEIINSFDQGLILDIQYKLIYYSLADIVEKNREFSFKVQDQINLATKKSKRISIEAN